MTMPGTAPPMQRPEVPLTQRKMLGLPAPVVIVGGIVVVVLLWKHYKSSQSSSSAAPVSTCAAVDANGNCIQAGTNQYGPWAYDMYGSPYGFGSMPGVACPWGTDQNGNCLPNPNTTPNIPTPNPTGVTPQAPAPAPVNQPPAYNPSQPVSSQNPSTIVAPSALPSNAGTPGSPWEIIWNGTTPEMYNYQSGQAAPYNPGSGGMSL